MPTEHTTQGGADTGNVRIVPVILCGGSGTRLWPLSRGEHPKQFLKLIGDRSPFQEAVQRAWAVNGAGSLMVVGNESYRFMLTEELEACGVFDAELLLEPVGRNTAPALAVAALQEASSRAGTLLLALPADHHVADQDGFAAAIARGLDAARQGSLVVFGVAPTVAETAYGYIRKGALRSGGLAYEVREFKEKPDLVTASGYVASREYYWNSGIFLVRADVYLHELKSFAPDIFREASAAIESAKDDGKYIWLGRQAFSNCRSESIDYAVMEHTRSAVVVELGAGWSDLGTWASLRDAASNGSAENVTCGDVFLKDVTGSIVHSTGRLVAAVGLRDQVVVETADAVFVAPLSRAADVKLMVEELKKNGREEAQLHKRVYRPWGWYEGVARGERMQVKRIEVKPGASLSLQLHHHRAEHWVVIRGEAEVTRGEEVFLLRHDESTYIPVETKHRLRNPGAEPLEIVEVQTGSYVGEDDIVRFEDNYGRASDIATG